MGDDAGANRTRRAARRLHTALASPPELPHISGSFFDEQAALEACAHARAELALAPNLEHAVRLAVFMLSGLGLLANLHMSQRSSSYQACLHSFAVGGRALQEIPCGDGDPLGLAKNRDLAKVISTLDIRPELIRFRGCKDGLYSTAEEHTSGSSEVPARYVVTYPSDSRVNFLAPITHELAHVLQIQSAGGLAQLKTSLDSKRIELAADFLTGIVFSHVLPQAGLGEFQHNLSLRGLYRDSSSQAHGSPAERTSAFRRGVFFNFASVGRDFRRASRFFQANIFGELVTIPGPKDRT